MRRAVFITGFNNWGKSTIIRDLFNGRKRFRYDELYAMSGVNFATEFTVQSQSNDDLWGQAWADKVIFRNGLSPDNGANLLSALCPAVEKTNNFINLLSNPPFNSYDKLYIFLIEYKWEHHAKLIIDNIISAGQHIPNIDFIVINADQNLINDDERYNAKIVQIQQELESIFDVP